MVVYVTSIRLNSVAVFLFQAEDGIRDLVRSRGLGDVYKRQTLPILREVRKSVGKPIRLIHFDAHLDTYPAAWDLSLIHI